LADPVEQDHYVKRLAKELDINEDAVRAKLDQDESASGYGTGSTPIPESEARAQMRASAAASPRKRGSRVELEESLLAINLAYPITRLSLDDLSVLVFSTPERQGIFQALKAHHELPGAELAATLTDLTDYSNILLLRGEEEFYSIAPADRSFEAFGLARRLLITANKDRKQELSQRLRDAEKDGDVGLVSRLLSEYQAVLAEEE
jgi:DNA primase